VSSSLKGFQNRSSCFGVGPIARLLCFLETSVKRLHVILGMIAAAILGPNKWFRPLAATTLSPHRKTWAEHVAEVTSKSRGRRYECWTHMKVCHGDFDDRLSRRERASRRSRCANICGLCRYINSLAIWPGPKYRRPPQATLDALEAEQFYSLPRPPVGH
jgi:hypothetical protein